MILIKVTCLNIKSIFVSERKDMTKKTKKSNNLLNDIHEQAEKFSRGEEIANFLEEKNTIVKNTLKKGVLQSENPQKKANEIYDLIEKFGGYGFNKSHSAAYSLIVYWTAFFKANYPLEFFAAIMSVEVSNLDRFQIFVNEAKKKDIDLLLPDVNICNKDFEVVKEKTRRKENEKYGSIRFGFCGIKGIGEKLLQSLSEEAKNRNFSSYEDFAQRMKDNEMTAKQLEILNFSWWQCK